MPATKGEGVLTEDRIERETLIEAPIERVWALVAQPGWWAAQDMGDVAGTVASVGETVIVSNSNHGDFPVHVERVDPPTFVAYRWSSAFPGQELSDDNSTLIEFTLIDEGGRTRLRVVESGFGELAGSGELRHQAFTDNTAGWAEMIEVLKNAAERSAA
jgi:uncharacterized protein YndB with AHSA1/START domain